VKFTGTQRLVLAGRQLFNGDESMALARFETTPTINVDVPAQSARDLRDTDDLVQDTLLRAFKRLETFENRGEGAFLAYLRQSLLNAIRDDLRRAVTRPCLSCALKLLPQL
jgi:DNA-directed RNA polymerase specialized sigma24 family protein